MQHHTHLNNTKQEIFLNKAEKYLNVLRFVNEGLHYLLKDISECSTCKFQVNAFAPLINHDSNHFEADMCKFQRQQ